jgi:hypothetical protein
MFLRKERIAMQIRILCAVLVLVCLQPVELLAQYETALQTGQIPFQSYDVNEIDSVNLQNGNVSVRIPLVAYPQIGAVLNLSFAAVYNSKSGYAGHVCPPPPGGRCDWDWESTGTTVPCCTLGGSLNPSAVTIVPEGFYGAASWPANPPLVQTTTYTNASGQLVHYYSACGTDGCHQLAQTDGGYRSIDATGISANVTAGQVVDKGGIQFTRVSYPNSGVIARDPYGNAISYSSTTGVITDTMGRTFSGTYPSGVWSFPGPNGGTLTFTVSTVMSNYSNQIPPSSPSSKTSIYGPTSQSILLPDGRSWVFQYAGTAGELTQITLPTGGTISYAYTSKPNSQNTTGNWSRYLTSRTVSDGTHAYTWKYAYNLSAQTTHSTTVTTPNGDDVVHQFQCVAGLGSGGACDGFYEVSVKYYKGSSQAQNPVVLRTEATTYSYSGIYFCVQSSPCVLQTINVTPASKKITLDDGVTSSTTSYAYDSSYTIPNMAVGSGGSYGDLTQQFDYDYTGTLLRKTVNSYLFQSNSSYKTLNMLDRVQSTTISNGSGQQVAQTTYGYDEGMSTLTGSNTSIQRWLNTTGSSLTIKYAYNSNGTRSQMTDPLLNVTNSSTAQRTMARTSRMFKSPPLTESRTTSIMAMISIQACVRASQIIMGRLQTILLTAPHARIKSCLLMAGRSHSATAPHHHRSALRRRGWFVRHHPLPPVQR